MQLIAFKTSQICLHMSVAFAVAYAFTGSLAVGGVAAVVEPICNVTLMPLHDKLWERMRQRHQRVQYSIESNARLDTTPSAV